MTVLYYRFKVEELTVYLLPTTIQCQDEVHSMKSGSYRWRAIRITSVSRQQDILWKAISVKSDMSKRLVIQNLIAMIEKKDWCLKSLVYTAPDISISTSIKALANEDTLLPTQMFPRLPARSTFVRTQIVSGTQKMFLILFRNILCP